MEFETVERCGRVYVVKNGVESAAFVQKVWDGWRQFIPDHIANFNNSQIPLEIIATNMDTWYTSAQAAERLVEMGAYDSPPSVHTMSNLTRAGAFAGAFKLRGLRGGRGGQGGAWRIPEAGLQAFVERRKGQ